MDKSKLRKIYIAIIAIYVAVVTSFYFIAGEQLWYKESTKNIDMVDADSITVEIVKAVVIEQDFTNSIDKLESLAIVFTKNYVEGDGTLTVDLLEGSYLLARKTISVVDVPEQHRVYLEPVTAVDGEYGKTLTLRIYANSKTGQAAHVMMCTDSDCTFEVNGEIQNGTLCFSATGSEELTYSSYYWFVVGGVGVLLAVLLASSYKKYTKGISDFIALGFDAVFKYEFLISQLVKRDFKSKYKRSILGMFWSFLNPLLTMTVQFLVFSTIFKADTKSYPVYLLSGVICFNFFREATDMCLVSISGNSNLINKVYIPKYIFPLSKTFSSVINLGISLVPLFLVSFVLGLGLHSSTILSFYFLFCLVVFSFGVGLFLSAIMVFFRDTQFLWGVVTQIWMYATPIFYSAEIIPDKYKFIIKINPLYHFIGNFRKCLMDGISPEPFAYIYCLLFALVSVGVGLFTFKKTQDKFTLYL